MGWKLLNLKLITQWWIYKKLYIAEGRIRKKCKTGQKKIYKIKAMRGRNTKYTHIYVKYVYVKLDSQKESRMQQKQYLKRIL